MLAMSLDLSRSSQLAVENFTFSFLKIMRCESRCFCDFGKSGVAQVQFVRNRKYLVGRLVAELAHVNFFGAHFRVLIYLAE